MKRSRIRFRAFFLIGLGSFVFLIGCGENGGNQDLAKMAMVAGGAGGGALLANKMASEDNKTLSTFLGGAAGGALGYFLGNSLMGTSTQASQ